MGESKYFTDLLVWKKVRDLKNRIFEITKRFPAEEKFRLSDQIIRCSQSVTSNLAEGHGRFSYKDQIHFCMQSRGSLYETKNHLVDALDSGYISKEEWTDICALIDEVGRLLNGYINYLRQKIT